MKSIPRPKKDKPASDAGPSKFNRVVEIGRERKYVPAGEREQFSGDPGSSEEISSVISLLGDGDGDGEIAVEAAEDSPFAEAEEDTDEKWVPEVPEEKEEREDRSSLLRDSSDPVRMYLQEMGGVALLSWYRTSRLGKLREQVFVKAPISYSAWRFGRSLYGNKGYSSF